MKSESESIMNEVATGFERKFLFSVGRHFWNFVAVCGFVSLALGGLTALESQVESYKDRMLLNEELNEVPEFQAWVNSKCYELKPRDSYKTIEHQWMCDKFSYLTKQETSFARYCSSVGLDGERYKSSSFVDGECEGYEWRPYFVYEYINQYRSQHSAEVETTNNKRAEQLQIKVEMATKLGLAGLISAWGLGVVAVSSLYSALLAIERNTRNRDVNTSI